ncbi:MAG: hypothetical protein HFI68_10870 [Lachnospiraceae bacterium]|nr:hypothetical protein [Lachnospiraceae bacterium]
MMRRRGRILSFLIAVCLMAGVMPMGALAEPGTSGIARAAGTGAIQIRNATNSNGGISGYDAAAGYDYIYYGTWQGNPVKWRVLDEEASDGTSDHLFLLSDALLASGDPAKETIVFSGSGPQWHASDAKKWCRNFSGETVGSAVALSAGELAALMRTIKSDAEYMGDSGVESMAINNILPSDTVFFLSNEEAQKEAYGLGTPDKRKASYNGTEGGWWLRSTAKADTSNILYMDDTGVSAMCKPMENYYARPAMNLNMDAVLFTSAANGKSSGATGADALKAVEEKTPSEWKLTLKDSSRNGFTAAPAAGGSSVTVKNGGSVKVTYSGAGTDAKDFVSAMIEEKDSGDILYYGRIVNQTAGGDMDIKIPESLPEGEYILKVFSEQYNGDRNTDYASDFRNIDLTVTDGTPPVLTRIDAVRKSEAEAVVKFKSSEEGTYRYAVVAEGDPAPADIAAWKDGGGCDTKEQTILLDNLTKGAWDVYIIAKDAAGNESRADFKITVPEGISDFYAIEATPEDLNFGRAKVGYTQPEAQTVTVKNVGNREVILTQPVSGDYEIGTLSKTTLPVGDSAEFTVRPKAGLSIDQHLETILISGSNGAEASVTADFTVTDDTVQEYIIEAAAGNGGSISPEGRQTVSEGGSLTFTITPDTGFEIDRVMVDGLDNGTDVTDQLEGGSRYTFEDVMENHTIYALFKAVGDPKPPQTFKITTSASPEAGGETTPRSETYTENTEVTVKAEPSKGYRFVRWTENGNEVSTEAEYRFLVTGDRDLVAVFEEAPGQTYTVTVNGSYAAQSGAGSYEQEAAVTIHAGTRPGYRFDGWMTNDEITFANASSADTTFTMPAKDVTVVAKWLYVSSNSGASSSGNSNNTSGSSGSGSGTVTDGKSSNIQTGDTTNIALWMAALWTSFGVLMALLVMEFRYRKLYPEITRRWDGLTEKEF